MKHRLSERIKNFNITILISLFLLISCGSGQQPQAGKDGEAATGGSSLSAVMMHMERTAQDAFYAFMGLIADTLGLRVTKDTTKNDVGVYFKGLAGGIEKSIGELLAVSSKTDQSVQPVKEEKESELSKAIEGAKDALTALKGYLDSLGTIGDSNPVGWAANNAQGTAVDEAELKKAFKALKGIMDTAEGAGVARPEVGNIAVKVGNGTDNKDGAKILATDGAAAVGDSGKAAAILTTVSGKEILASIVNSTEGKAVKITGNVTAETTPLEFAVGGTAAHVSNSDQSKAAAVSGGIALRSLVKDGKLAANNNDDDKASQGVGVTAVNKLLGAVEDIIKKTVKNVLDKVKKEVDEVRKPKTAVQ
ncbi:variable large family protein [Borrelia turicatae]|uniref:variable large family protein n=1 Tax=Borrelia turicatae TaxID=142 RepID=UPI001FF570A1|nr:variable large family protein [Borrelia turicatae]UPA14362.1 variable large family protein [Borrelia turicatae 91E135]